MTDIVEAAGRHFQLGRTAERKPTYPDVATAGIRSLLDQRFERRQLLTSPPRSTWGRPVLHALLERQRDRVPLVWI